MPKSRGLETQRFSFDHGSRRASFLAFSDFLFRKLQSSRERRLGLFPMPEEFFRYPFIPPNHVGNTRSVAIWSRNPLLSLGRVNSSLVPAHTDFIQPSFYHLPHCRMLFPNKALSPGYVFFHCWSSNLI